MKSFAVGILFLKLAFAQTWPEKMQGFKGTLLEILPYMSSETAYLAPENELKIEELLKKLQETSHNVSKPQEALDADPTLPIVADILQKQMSTVLIEFKGGRKSHSRSILRSLPGHCVACHSRANGPDYSFFKDASLPEKMATIEKAETYIALRSFDKALNLLSSLIHQKYVGQVSLFEWERAARLSILIQIRVKDNLPAALEVVNLILSNEDSPNYLKEDATFWKKSLNAEIKNKKKTFKNESEWYAEATRLLEKAQSIQKYPSDRSAEILYLKLSSTLHQMTRLYPKGKHFSEGLWMLGVSYEALRNLEVGSFYETLFETCIHVAPHSAVSQKCFNRLEESILVSFSNTGSFSVPSDVRFRLTELKSLAEPSAKQKNR